MFEKNRDLKVKTNIKQVAGRFICKFKNGGTAINISKVYGNG